MYVVYFIWKTLHQYVITVHLFVEWLYIYLYTVHMLFKNTLIIFQYGRSALFYAVASRDARENLYEVRKRRKEEMIRNLLDLGLDMNQMDYVSPRWSMQE